MEQNIFPMPSHEIVLKIEEVNGYSNRRRMEYQRLEEQLGMIFKDIEKGLFGENAKTGAFFTHIKDIKDKEPKPENIEELKAELDALILADIESEA